MFTLSDLNSLLLSCVEPALGARWKGDWSPLVIVNWDLPQADGAQGQYGWRHKMWAFLFHHKGRSGGKCGWSLYRSHILRSCLEGQCHESEICSVSICGRGRGGVRCNSRAVSFLVTVMEVNLGDQEIVSHVSASILAVVIVLSLDSTLGSLVAVISHGQWGQINSQPLGKPLTTHSLLWNQAEIS